MRKEILVCDVCETVGRDTVPCSVTVDGQEGVFDLCDEHSQPLRELLPDTESPPKASTPAPRKSPPRSRKRKITTIEEIEASKKKQ